MQAAALRIISGSQFKNSHRTPTIGMFLLIRAGAISKIIWTYLSGSTAGVGEFEIDLGSELNRYRLPTVAVDPIGAMKLSLDLLKVAPLRVSAPLLSARWGRRVCKPLTPLATR